VIQEGNQNPSRRKFLAITSVAATGLGVGWWKFRSAPTEVASSAGFPDSVRKTPDADAPPVSPASAVAEDLSDHDSYLQSVHTEFKVITAGQPSVEIRLEEVTPVGKQEVKGTMHENFALLFSGPGEHPLPDAIHRFHHERLGELEFFLSAYGKPGPTMRYQAFFDRAV
jgi:hypothetical protein